MKKFYRFISLSTLLFTFSFVCYSQESSSEKQWNFTTDINFYFIPNDFFVLPVIKADKNKLHLEARYNYEDMQTFSGWVGYNFNGGDEFSYAFTPMVGGVVGLSNGIAPGLEMTLGYKNFELYSESEYMFDTDANVNNFYYNWSDLTYSAKEWLWFGISGQRTRLYKTDLDIQRGLLIGSSFKSLEINGYLYNLGFDDPFFLVTLTMGF